VSVVAQTQNLETQTFEAKDINPKMNQVLVVAEPINQQLLMNQLSASSFQLSGVTTKDAAMERIQSGLFDLVMLDIEMAQGFSCGANDFIAIPCDDLEFLARLQA
jgi:CheY-like chemotaxis protein